MLTAVFWTVGISLKWITGVLEGRGRLRTLEIILEKQSSSTGNPQPNMTLRMGMTAVSRSEGHCQEQIHGNLYSEFSKRAGLSGEADKQLIRKLGFWGPQNWLLTYPAAWKGGAGRVCSQCSFLGNSHQLGRARQTGRYLGGMTSPLLLTLGLQILMKKKTVWFETIVIVMAPLKVIQYYVTTDCILSSKQAWMYFHWKQKAYFGCMWYYHLD